VCFRGIHPEGERLQAGVSSNAAWLVVASEPLATIWPLSLIAVASVIWSPDGSAAVDRRPADHHVVVVDRVRLL
jgi:hypothetical protein